MLTQIPQPYDVLLHFGVFFIVSILFIRREKKLLSGLYIMIAVAVLSEIVQLFIPSRSFQIHDMAVNFLGIAAGTSLLILYRECYPTFKKYYQTRHIRRRLR